MTSQEFLDFLVDDERRDIVQVGTGLRILLEGDGSNRSLCL